MAWETLYNGFDVDVKAIMISGTVRSRPMAVRGYIKSGTSRSVATCAVCVPQGGLPADSKIANTEAGHLFPLELGGADSMYNLVPMFGGVNRGTYREVERRYGAAAKGAPNPALKIVVAYPTAGADALDVRIPTSMTVSYFHNLDKLSNSDTTVATETVTINNYDDSPARMTITGTDIQLRDALIVARNSFAASGWVAEKAIGNFASFRLPPVNQRPNAWLDWLIYESGTILLAQNLLSKVSQSQFTIGPGHPFYDPQRSLLVLANMLTQPFDAKKGECWSDASDDPIKSALTALGTDNGIHIDHIVPEASSGPNIYSNAAVVSALFNKQKGRS